MTWISETNCFAKGIFDFAHRIQDEKMNVL
jgi:hypothetical protein